MAGWLDGWIAERAQLAACVSQSRCQLALALAAKPNPLHFRLSTLAILAAVRETKVCGFAIGGAREANWPLAEGKSRESLIGACVS